MNEGSVRLENMKSSAEMFVRQSKDSTNIGIKYFDNVLNLSIPNSVELEKSPEIDMFIKEASKKELGFNSRSIQYIIDMAKNFRA